MNNKFERNTHITVVLDESGSMSAVAASTISGFMEWAQTVAGATPDAKLTLVKFNSYHGIRVPFMGQGITSFRNGADIGYAPNGLTPLYDAIGEAIRRTEQDLSPNTDVLFVIITDGMENSSHSENRETIFRKINEKQELGWIFTFMGSNQDAWGESSKIGMYQGNTMTYDAMRPNDAWASNASNYARVAGIRAATGRSLSASATVMDYTGTPVLDWFGTTVTAVDATPAVAETPRDDGVNSAT